MDNQISPETNVDSNELKISDLQTHDQQVSKLKWMGVGSLMTLVIGVLCLGVVKLVVTQESQSNNSIAEAATITPPLSSSEIEMTPDIKEDIVADNVDKGDLSVPNVLGDWNWKSRQITGEDAQKLDYWVYWKREASPTERGRIFTTGTLYEIKADDIDPEYKNLRDYFMNGGVAIFSQILESNYWDYANVNYGEYSLDGVGGDGPRGTHLGYIKISNNEVKTIAISTLFNPSGVSHEDGPSCPCSISAKIFVSDPITLTDDVFKPEEYNLVGVVD